MAPEAPSNPSQDTSGQITRERLPVDATREVGCLWRFPADDAGSAPLLVLGHGAGAGMEHPFLDAFSARLADRGVATLRYQFPYMDAGKRRPDGRAVLFATVRSAIDRARTAAPNRPLFAGGKSMGGRMTSMALADRPEPGVRGLVFVGFPLHPAGRPGTDRAEHLAAVEPPMLFLQGTRDKLADLDLLRPELAKLDRPTLTVIEGADHGFHVLKRSGRTDDEVLDELADHAAGWMSER